MSTHPQSDDALGALIIKLIGTFGPMVAKFIWDHKDEILQFAKGVGGDFQQVVAYVREMLNRL